MGEDSIMLSGCDLYIDGQYFGQAKIELKTIQNKETCGFDISEEDKEKLKKIINRVLESAKMALSKFLDMMKKFFNDNPRLVKIVKRKIKYEKTVRNRQKLYNKRKALGRVRVNGRKRF